MRSLLVIIILAAPAAAQETAVAVAKQEIGARLGTQLNVGGMSPGGVRLGGVYLYKLAASTWFDSEASVTFGSQDPQPGVASGFGFAVGGGARWFFGGARASGVHPYVRAGVSLELGGFAADGVTGLGIPVWGGAGARWRVSERVAVGFEALVGAGPVFYGGSAPDGLFVRMIVQGGVELAL